MDNGAEFREAFMDILNEFKQNVIIYKNYGQGNAANKTVVGLKNTEKSGGKRIVFQFPEKHDIKKGDVLQLQAGSDLWTVIDTEEEIIGNTFVYFKAFVEKIT